MDTSIEYAIEHYSPVMCHLRKFNHYKLLSDILKNNIDGDIVECGSYTGEGSTMVISAVMHNFNSNKTLHIYDSFQGLSKFNDIDNEARKCGLNEGSFSSPRSILEKNISIYNINKLIHDGWFHSTLPNELPDKICYAHIDNDLYEPTVFCLENIYHRLTKGAICIVDDYHWPPFPGVTKAFDEFLQDKSEKLNLLPNTIHAFFIKN